MSLAFLSECGSNAHGRRSDTQNSICHYGRVRRCQKAGGCIPNREYACGTESRDCGGLYQLDALVGAWYGIIQTATIYPKIVLQKLLSESSLNKTSPLKSYKAKELVVYSA
jgi:hypothetical protein